MNGSYPVTKSSKPDNDGNEKLDLNGGALKYRAMKAGMPVEKFAEANIGADSAVGKLARLYYLQQGVHGVGKSNMATPGDNRTSAQKLYQIG